MRSPSGKSTRLICATLMAAAAIGWSQARAEGIVSATMRLEAAEKNGLLSSGDKSRLAQIYFMTSRCADARRELAGNHGGSELDSGIECACGGRCAERSVFGYAERMRAQLTGGAPWRGPVVQATWRELRRYPEVQYMMYRYLSGAGLGRDPAAGAMRVELESRLQSLEVRK